MAAPKSDKTPEVTEKESVVPAKPKTEPKVDPLEKYKKCSRQLKIDQAKADLPTEN